MFLCTCYIFDIYGASAVKPTHFVCCTGNLELCHNLANSLYEKHADKFIPCGGLGGRAYAELRLGKADWPQWGSLLKSYVWTNPAWQRLLNPSGQATMPSAAPTAMKDVVGYQAEFGNYKKIVVAGSDLMAMVNGRSTHCIVVECSDGDVPYSEGLLRVANGGTPVIMFGKATVIQDWLDQNTGDGAFVIFGRLVLCILGCRRATTLPAQPQVDGVGWDAPCGAA